jgi:hypothetical protein
MTRGIDTENMTMNQTMTTSPAPLRRLLALATAALAALLVAAVLLPAVASADFGIRSFDGAVTNADGTPATQAGAHPYAASTTIQFNERPDANGNIFPDEAAKDISVGLPAGFVGNATALPQCREEQLESLDSCPTSTAIGVTDLKLSLSGFPLTLHFPVFNMVPPKGAAADFAFNTGFVSVIHVLARVRSDTDNGVSVDIHNLNQVVGLLSSTLTLWGVPSDARHDPQRGHCATIGGTCPVVSSPIALLTNPTSCNGPVVTTLSADSWAHPGRFVTASFATHDDDGRPLGADGCDKLPFAPTISAVPDTTVAGAPAGLRVDVDVPQTDGASALATAHVRTTTVTLPDGMTVNPSAADGLAGCSPAQAQLGSTAAAACPDAAKVGTVTIDSPLVDHPLEGSVFLASQNDNPFHALLALYLAVDDPQTGITLKIGGRVDPDPATGRLTATFADAPQLPFSRLRLSLFGGPRAALSNPPTCGTQTTSAELTSWSGATVRSSSSFTTSGDGQGGPCPAAHFTPGFHAGVQSPTAAQSSPFTLQVTRTDSDQALRSIATTLPEGLLADLSGLPRCSDAAASAGACPDASLIGHVSVGAGAGSSPFFITTGKAFLTEGYKGAPFGLAITVPAVAGPLDLGTVNVRAALSIDPRTAQATVVSDPLPSILQGIPLQVRDVRVAIDRPGFMRNPTSCTPMQITGAIGSTGGLTAGVADRFQAADCQALALKPKLALSLTGAGQTTDGKHPSLTASLTQPAGQANLHKVTVTLPLSLALDPDNSQSGALCAFTAGKQTIPDCPASSIVGTATARTPILDQPLTGPVYFIKNVRVDAKTGREIKTLPTLAVVLKGEGVTLVLRATTAVPDGKRLVTTFDTIPDAPVSSFQLHINGGKKGILVVSGADVCKATQVADQAVDGQNGRAADAHVTVATPACSLRVISHTVGSKAVTLKIGGLGAGKVKVSGTGVTTTGRTLTSATVATVTAPLTGAGRRHRPTKLRVSFTPSGAKKAKAITASLRPSP